MIGMARLALARAIQTAGTQSATAVNLQSVAPETHISCHHRISSSSVRNSGVARSPTGTGAGSDTISDKFANAGLTKKRWNMW